VSDVETDNGLDAAKAQRIHGSYRYDGARTDLGGRGWLGDWELATHLRKGTKNWTVGSVELDGRWRPRYGDFWRFTPYLYAQFFSGYGETLLNYDRSSTAFRIGIGFTDLSTRSE